MTREAQEYWSGQPIPSPGDLPHPGTELGSPALQAALPAEPPGRWVFIILDVSPNFYERKSSFYSSLRPQGSNNKPRKANLPCRSVVSGSGRTQAREEG